MAVNKVEANGRTLIDLTSDTVSPENLLEGVTAHDRSGEAITGTRYTPKIVTKEVDVSSHIYRDSFTISRMKDISVGVFKPSTNYVLWTKKIEISASSSGIPDVSKFNSGLPFIVRQGSTNLSTFRLSANGATNFENVECESYASGTTTSAATSSSILRCYSGNTYDAAAGLTAEVSDFAIVEGTVANSSIFPKVGRVLDFRLYDVTTSATSQNAYTFVFNLNGYTRSIYLDRQPGSNFYVDLMRRCIVNSDTGGYVALVGMNSTLIAELEKLAVGTSLRNVLVTASGSNKPARVMMRYETI